MSAHAVRSLVFTIFVAAMLGLAGGAVWMVAAMYLRGPSSWLILPIGIVLGLVIRTSVSAAGRGAALLAALATVLAAIYFNILMAGLMVAGNMGMGLVDALRTAGAGLLWQLASMSVSRAEIGWTILAAILAAVMALRPLKQRTR
jgi:vitamin B12 transport system permease protein